MMRTMRDSGIEWIGEIPITWDARRTKELFGTLSGNGLSTDLQADDGIPFYKAGDISACDKFLEVAKSFVDFSIAEKRSFNIIPAMSIVFAKIGEAMKKNSRAITTIECCIDNNCQALIPKSIDLGFAYYLLLCIDMRWFDNAGTLPCVSVYKLMQSLMPYPPLAEQKKIADFLDGKCAEIDELVQTEEKMIEELKAYKQSVITEAVTKGLDSAAPMKDSGIEWIGAIPQSWRTMPIKHCCKINLESLKDTEKDDLLINYIDISSADENGNINFVDEITFLNAPSRARRIIRKGDVIISTVRTYLKVIALIDEKYDGFICSTGFAVLTPLEKVEARFLYYNIYTDSFTSRVSYYSNGISYPAINSSVLATLHITLPSIDEQKQIADYLDEKCAKIDEMIAIRNEQIDQLKDYKKSLIYEYVTGKKEVV